MKRIILAALILSLSMTTPVFGDSAFFYIADAAQEDACGVTGYFNRNRFGVDAGWAFFGYYSPYGSYYSTYWRWAVDIPSGSVINEADVTMFSINDNADPFDAAFAALEPDGKWGNPAGFSDANYSNGTALKTIPRAGESVLWENVPEWNSWLWYTGPDISSLVQNRIDSGAYNPAVPGESYLGLVLFHVSGDGFRGGSQEEYSNEHTAILYVDWTPPECPGAVEICGDGIDNNCDGQIDEFCNECPVADAGPDPFAHVGETVQLDGSGSTDADGDMLTYAWTLIDKPDGSAAVLSDSTALMPFMEIDLPGEYVVELVVNDGTCESEPDIVTVNTLNTCPTADAGIDTTVHVGDLITLVGAGGDADGDALTYSWFLVEKPEGSAAELATPATVTPSLRVDLPGEYLIELTVDDGLCMSEPDSMTISTYNVRPVADAGPNTATLAGLEVALDGGASYDLDGDPLSYSWSLLSRPYDSDAMLSDPWATEPTFYTDVAGDYVVQLIVSDGELESEPDTCVIAASTSQCPEKRSYWKKHTDEWPVEHLEIAGEIYDFEDLLALLTMSSRGDASVKLAREFIAAKLNISNGCDPTPIENAVWEAEEILAEYSAKLPFQVKSSSQSGRSMKELARDLKSYNSGKLTPDCKSDKDRRKCRDRDKRHHCPRHSD